MKKTLILIMVGVLLITLFGCGDKKEETAATQSTEKKITVTCAGDCTLGTDVAFDGGTFPDEVEAQNKDYSYFLRNVKPYFESDDLTIVNFEGTLTKRGSRQDKTFAFKGDPEYTKILTTSSVEAVTLANNHSRDYGEESFEDTKKYLGEAGITYFEKLNTVVKDVKGVKVGLVGLYDLDNSANDNLPKAMEKVKNDGAEIIIVQIHWGIEGENYPEDSQIQLAHKAIDSGADLVIGHHPHVLQGLECYKGKMIAYSMGNFCFGGNQNPSDKDTMIYRQTFTVRDGKSNGTLDYYVIPCSISSSKSRNNYQPTPANGDEKTRIQNKIQKFTDKLGNLDVSFDEGESLKNGGGNNENSGMIL